MELRDVRIKNSLYWYKKLGREPLAEKLGYDDPNYVTGLVNGGHSFGNKTARRFEEHLDLPALWMDTPHPGLWGEEGKAASDRVESALSGFGDAELELAIIIAAGKLARHNN